jgi:hypothetical protein
MEKPRTLLWNLNDTMRREALKPEAERGFGIEVEYESMGWTKTEIMEQLAEELRPFGYHALVVGEGIQQELVDQRIARALVDGHEQMRVLVVRCQPVEWKA